MEIFQEESRFREVFKSKSLFRWIIIFICMTCGFGISIFALYNLFTVSQEEIVTSQDIDSQVCEQQADFGEITVYVSGAIVNPGLYVLQYGDRVADVIDLAGGLSVTVDNVFVHKQINFAKILKDEEQLYIPTQTETEDQLTMEFNSFSKNEIVVENLNKPISINSSTQSELETLDGIGAVRAQKIIENRPFNSINELLEKEVLSETLLLEIKEKIIL